MMNVSSEPSYEDRALRLLASFQALELSLKLYITSAYKVVVVKLGNTMPFLYSYKDIENCSLEKLLNIFARLNTNTALQDRLNKLRKARNDIAHVTLVYRHKVVQDVLGIDLQAHSADLAAAETELDECLVMLADELQDIFTKANEIAA